MVRFQKRNVWWCHRQWPHHLHCGSSFVWWCEISPGQQCPISGAAKGNLNTMKPQKKMKLWKTTLMFLLSCCLTSTEARWPIRDRDRVGRGWQSEESTMETAWKRPERRWTAARTMEVLRWCPLATAQWLVHCAIALSTAVLDRITKTMPVAPLLMNNLDNLKQKMSNLLNPALPPYSWSLLGKVEGPAPPPSSKISWSFDLAWKWNPAPDWPCLFYNHFSKAFNNL